MSFPGFSDKAYGFSRNRFNNSKQWYDSHRDEYKKYVYNLLLNCNELAPTWICKSTARL